MIKPKIFVISGPSGSGKTTLADGLLKYGKLRKLISRPASFTTRPRRSGEKDGRHYFFIGDNDFRAKLKAQKILEWTKYLGYYYATSRDLVNQELKQGKNVILCLDLKGALRIRKLYPRSSVTIFILPPSIEALRNRIKGRCQRTANEEICKRLKLAEQEVIASDKYDYRVENKDLADAEKELRQIILKEIGLNKE